MGWRLKDLSGLGPKAQAQLKAAIAPESKRSKLNASREVVDGINFHSRIEAAVYRIFRDAKLDFDLQPKFVLQEGFRDDRGKKIRPITYSADFRVRARGLQYVIDVKGFETEAFKRNQKMVLRQYGVRLLLLKSKRDALGFIYRLQYEPKELIDYERACDEKGDECDLLPGGKPGTGGGDRGADKPRTEGL